MRIKQKKDACYKHCLASFQLPFIMYSTNIILNIAIVYLAITDVAGKSYEGCKVYEVTPQSYEATQFFHYFADDKFDILKEGKGPGDAIEVMVPPEDQWLFEKEVSSHGIEYKTKVENIERIFEDERAERRLTRSNFGLGSVTFSNFMLYEEQMAYLRRLAQDYPDIVTVESAGLSYEGRELLVLKLSSGPNATSPKPAIFIDAGIHAREWIAPPVALYVIQQLVENTTNAQLYQNVDWYILPNLNPDGYVYSQTNDRLWRKNRRLTTNALCYGTDLNRNFGYYWMVGGASNNSCSQTFAGPEPFSEPEARALRDWILQHKNNIKLYLTVHSFGEYLLYPWGYSSTLPEDVEELQSLGDKVAQAIEDTSQLGSSYMVNSSAVGLYVAAGVTSDWTKGEAGVELSYTFELPAGDAPFAFMIPARQIRPVVEETWAGIRVFYEYIEEKFVRNGTAT